MAEAPSSIPGGSQALPGGSGSLDPKGKFEGKGQFVTPSGKRSVKARDGDSKVGRDNISAPGDFPSNKERTVTVAESEMGDEEKALDQDPVDYFDEVETASTYSNESVYTDSFDVQDGPEDQRFDNQDVISPPNQQLPVPVNPKTAEASITISGGGGEVDTQGASLTIEGGSKIDEKSLWGAVKNGLKNLWNLAADFASKHKIAIGLALSIIFVFIMSSPAGPGIVGGLFGAALISSLGASIACALVGAVMVDLIGGIGPYADQTPAQNNAQNQQGNQKDAPTSDKSEKNKTTSESQQNSGTPESVTASGSDGAFFLTPKEKMVAADGQVPIASTDPAGTPQEKPFSLDVFHSWLDQNFGRWVNKGQFQEFSTTSSGDDNYQALQANNKLDEYLKDLSQKRKNLSWIAGRVLEEKDGSGYRQWVRLYNFNQTLESALVMLNPNVDHCQKMLADLWRILPKDEFPYVSSDLDSPLLSVGVHRKSLEGLKREEMAKVEASDFIKLTLRNLRNFAEPESSTIRSDQDIQVTWDQQSAGAIPENRAKLVDAWDHMTKKRLSTTFQVYRNEPWLTNICNVLKEGATNLKWGATGPNDPLQASGLEALWMADHGHGQALSAWDKRYFEIAVEQAALAVKCKIESTVGAEDIDLIMHGDSGEDEDSLQRKEQLIDSILDSNNSNKGNSKYCIDDAFQLVNASREDRVLIKGYLKDLLMNNWMI